MLSVRLLALDHYMSKPLAEIQSSFNGQSKSSSQKEPVLRLFGPTSTGEKACVHIHGVYPYLYVPYDGGENPDRDCLLLATGLDRALQSTMDEKYRFSPQRHVQRVVLVSGKPFYGYHARSRQFLKVYFFNPFSVRKAAEVLLSGAVLNMRLQPHESHIPFTLQFMIDFNLFGMSFVNFANVKYRRNTKAPETMKDIEESLLLPATVAKMSHSAIEVDVIAEDILNRVEERSAAANPGLAAIWAEEKLRRRQDGRPSQPTPQASQTRSQKAPFGIEAEFLRDLESRLEGLRVEDTIETTPISEPRTPYPAEVPDESNILEASIIEPGPETNDADLPPNSDETLVNETLILELTQRGLIPREDDDGKSAGEEEEEEEEGTGRVQGAEPDDEGADLDLTQPLSPPANWPAVPAETGERSSDSEDEFWRNMAEEIFQLDGAGDSSDSAAENRHAYSQNTSQTRQWRPETGQIPPIASNPANDSLASWSNSIMAILNEDNIIPSFETSPQEPYWYNNMQWEPWSWSESLASPVSNIQSPCASILSSAAPSPANTNILSPPSAILTPASEMDRYSDINFDMIGELSDISSPFQPAVAPVSPLDAQSGGVTRISQEPRLRNDSMSNVDVGKSLADKLKDVIDAQSLEVINNCSLTLQDYLKRFGEIVRVDFKMINNTEMVVVEYKPENKGAVNKLMKNKFIIKPLKKFIAEWCAADVKARNPAKSPKYINGFTSNRSKAKASNRGACRQKSRANINLTKLSPQKSVVNSLHHNVDSQRDKSIVKSFRIVDDETNSDSSIGKSCSTDRIASTKNRTALKLVDAPFLFDSRQAAAEYTSVNNLNRQPNATLSSSQQRPHSARCSSQQFTHSSELNNNCVNASCRSSNIATSNNNKQPYVIPKVELESADSLALANEQFENYYKNLRQSSKSTPSCPNIPVIKSEFEVIDLVDSNDEEDVPKKKSTNKEPQKPAIDPVQFVSQILSNYSALPKSSTLPPLSITVNIGDPSIPVQVNVQPPNRNIGSYDGNDDSSGDESSSSSVRRSRKKRLKYRPLELHVQRSPARTPSSSIGERLSVDNAQAPTAKRMRPARDLMSSLSSAGTSNVEGGSSTSRSTSNSGPKGTTPASSPIITKKAKSAIENLTQQEDTKPRRGRLKRLKVTKSAAASPIKSQTEKEIPQTDIIASSSDEDLARAGVSSHRKSLRSRRRLVDTTKLGESCLAAKNKRVLQLSQSTPELKPVELRTRADSESCNSPSAILLSELSSTQKEDEPNYIPISSLESNSSNDIVSSENEKQLIKESAKMEKELQLLLRAESTPKSHGSKTIPRKKVARVAKSSDDSLFSENSAKTPEMPLESQSVEETATETELFEKIEIDRAVNETENLDCFNESSTLCDDSFLPNATMKVLDSPSIHYPGEVESTSKVVITPAIKPPTFAEIESTILDYPIDFTTGIKPFYSDYRDVTKQVEVGTKLLKIENYNPANLKSFKSELDIVGIEERRTELVGKGIERCELVPNYRVVITPLQRPPSFASVASWCKKKSLPVQIEEAPAKPKLKFLVPGGANSDSDEESMSLTPCTPSILSDNSLTCTPASTMNDTPLQFEDEESPSERRRSSLDSPKAGPSRIGLTPTIARHRNVARRVSFDDAVLIRSPDSPVEKSTPDTRNSQIKRLPSITEEPFLKKGPLSRVKGRKRLLMESIANRRESTESNKSKDMFDAAKEVEVMKPEVLSDSDVSIKDLSAEQSLSKLSNDNSCQIRGVSLNNTFGFNNSLQNLQEARRHDFQHVTLLTIEVLTEIRGNLRADPQLDAILAIFYDVRHDAPPNRKQTETGVFTVGDPLLGAGLNVTKTCFPDEVSLLNHLITCIHTWDPDFLAGYEMEQGSWGYVLQRGCVLSLNLLPQMGRTVVENQEARTVDPTDDADDVPRFIRQLHVPGRVILNIWRLMRHELALNSYTFENIMYHLLHERHPLLSPRLLAHLWQHRSARLRHIPAEHYLTRVTSVARILNQLDLISRNSELARLFGIQFTEVLTRGTQFRVESMMLRLAKSQNLVAVSPNIDQRAHMRAPPCLPLVMEPESQYYTDPVIVLDFQSLYPSMIIAYNYCFSTCLGRVSSLGRGNEPFEFGCTRLSVPIPDQVNIADNIHITPAGVAFVKPEVVRGILPVMLEEILDTRIMVKRSMKECKDDKLLQKMLHARQLGLKLIANVTYGYTSANFSGRMPCIEVGDSVVSKGRETLQRAIRMVEENERWRARVVYGDTDSLFVVTRGRTREEAFTIGEEIAEAVTRDNPQPVKLKLEKVYQPCILQTKKRYVGYMYESANQKTPVYEAKGIETVRRDGCPAVAKILQKALQILFDTSDVTQVKRYAVRQFAKIFQHRVNFQDLIFAKEYRGRRGYRPAACVPALQLAKQWTAIDRRAEPRVKERVPYIISHGAPGVPLIRLVRSPRDFLNDPTLKINAAYYITKAIIPPLQRCFTLIGADPMTWYSEMPRRYHRMVRSGLVEEKKRSTISQYFASVECVVCNAVTNSRICPECSGDPQKSIAVLLEKSRNWESAYSAALEVCKSCCGRLDYLECESLDCPVLYRKNQLKQSAEQVSAVRQILCETFQF